MKYKLIKKLPFENSPQIGYISKPIFEDKPNQHYWNHSWFNPENHPEFWEKIVEKNYKILSLARFCSIKPIITNVSDYGDEFIEAMLKCDKARIHSVKRLSDNQIFTIGDKVRYNFSKETIIKTIEKIAFEKIGKCPEQLFIYSNGEQSTINNYIKVRTPLFQTFDKVDIFEGDIFYYVKIKKSKSIDKLWEVSKPIISLFIYEPEYEIYFSTKEKAEEYILLNKPCLSYGDIQEYLKIKDCNKVLNLIQEKLK